jgi:hypothetical protein
MPESYQTISNLLEIEEFEAIQATNILGDAWFENGRVFHDGDQVMFNSGPNPDSGQDEHRNHLKRCLTNLSLYRQSLYTSPNSDEFPEDEREEATEWSLLESLEALGISHSPRLSFYALYLP